MCTYIHIQYIYSYLDIQIQMQVKRYTSASSMKPPSFELRSFMNCLGDRVVEAIEAERPRGQGCAGSLRFVFLFSRVTTRV